MEFCCSDKWRLTWDGRKSCCCDSPARARACSQGKEKDAAKPNCLWCAMDVQLQYISSAAQTTPQVPSWEEKVQGALETAASWLSGETRQVLRGRMETQMTKAAAGEHLPASVFPAWPTEGNRRLLPCVCHVLANYLCLLTPSPAAVAYSNRICLRFRQCCFQVHLFPGPVGHPLEKEDIVKMGG